MEPETAQNMVEGYNKWNKKIGALKKRISKLPEGTPQEIEYVGQGNCPEACLEFHSLNHGGDWDSSQPVVSWQCWLSLRCVCFCFFDLILILKDSNLVSLYLLSFPFLQSFS